MMLYLIHFIIVTRQQYLNVRYEGTAKIAMMKSGPGCLKVE